MIVQTSFIASTIKKQHLFCTNTPEVWKISADYSLKSKALWLIACPVINGVWNLRRNINLITALEGLQKADNENDIVVLQTLLQSQEASLHKYPHFLDDWWLLRRTDRTKTRPRDRHHPLRRECWAFLRRNSCRERFLVNMSSLRQFFLWNPFMVDHSVIRDGKSNEMHQISLSVVRFGDDKQDRCDHWLSFYM